MFSIDLLKGKGTPRKNDLKGTVLKAVPFLIPVIAVMAWAASYQQDCARIEKQKVFIQKNQVMIDDAGQAVQSYCRMNAQLTEMGQYLETIAKGLSCRIQVSDLIVELVQTLPEDIFIHEMNLDRTATVKKTQEPKTGNKKEQVIIQRNLKITLCGFDSAKSDQRVPEYVDCLKKSAVLSEIFTDFKPAARQQGMVDGRAATFYKIECVLREQG